MRMFRDRHSARSRAFQVFANGLDTDVGATVDLPDAIAPLGLRRSPPFSPTGVWLPARLRSSFGIPARCSRDSPAFVALPTTALAAFVQRMMTITVNEVRHDGA